MVIRTRAHRQLIHDTMAELRNVDPGPSQTELTWNGGPGMGCVPESGAGETQLEAPTLVCCDKALEHSPEKGKVGFDMRYALREVGW